VSGIGGGLPMGVETVIASASETIQLSFLREESWIASSQTLLAMTAERSMPRPYSSR
jgi:hypothetical protein